MPRNIGDNELSDAKRGALIALSNNANWSDRKIAGEQGCSKSTVQNMRKRALENEKENIDPYSNVSSYPRKGRPPVISERDARQLIRCATSSRADRKKPWVQIGEECGFTCSPSAINHTFSSRGYGRYPPTYRPALNKEQKEKRKIFSDKALGILEGKYHLVIYTDETTVRVGERRGQHWVTRNQNERYHKDCIERRHKGFTEFLFCGAYTQNEKGPSHVWAKETEEEKQAASADLDLRNDRYWLEYQINKEEWEAENTRRPKYKQLKRIPKPKTAFLQRGDRSRGGVDWYCYQEDWIKPKLLPFIHQILEKYGEAYLVLDGAPSHNKKEQKELFSIPGLTVLDRPGNSPDLNQIEPAWYDIKRSVTKRGGGVATRDQTIELWEGVWKDLEKEKIKGWVYKMKSHLQRCSAQNGDNRFHG